jgi:hypothetical protein
VAAITNEYVKTLGRITGTTYDSQITALIASVQAKAERYCGRKFESAAYTEWHDAAEGQAFFFVQNPPITAITTLTHNEPLSPQTINQTNNVRQEADYQHRGKVELHNGEGVYYAGSGSIKIVYTGGWSDNTIPADLKQALAEQVLFEMNHAERVGLQNLRGDGAGADYAERGGLAEQVAVVLDGYRLAHKDFWP